MSTPHEGDGFGEDIGKQLHFRWHVYSQASRRVEAVGLGLKGFERKTQRHLVGVGYWQMG